MSDDTDDRDGRKEHLTDGCPGGLDILRRLNPAGDAPGDDAQTDQTDQTDRTDQTGRAERTPGPDRATTGVDRRTYLALAGGATAAAVAGTLGDAPTPVSGAATTETPETGTTESAVPETGVAGSGTEVVEPDVYGYGGSSRLEGGSTTLLTSASADSLTQTGENDERSTAMEISTDTTVEADLDPATVDWFAFEADGDDPLLVEFERSGATGVTGLLLYGPGGEFKEQLYVGTDSTHQLTGVATETGTHYVQVVDVEAGDGSYSVTVLLEDPSDDGSTDESTDDSDSTDDGQSPYGGTLRAVPGTIQAQDFDEGGQDVAYYDTTEENQGGEYRPDTYVDIEDSTDSTDAYSVGYTSAGEWLEYTVDVTSGSYDLEIRVATDLDDRQLAVTLGGETLRTVDVPNTGGWYTWETVTVDVDVATDGEAVLRLEFVTSGVNVNWLRFRSQETYGAQTYGEYGYGGVSA